MNFLLPLIVGGPDMAKKKESFRVNIKYYSNSLKNNKFKGYLAGLFEGNGHIWISNCDKEKYNPRFFITFNMKNEPLAINLLNLIKLGFISYKLQGNACKLVVSTVLGLKKVVHLLNGELRTPKIHQLHNLIDWLNKNHGTNITKLPIKDSSFYENNWLSGFIDSNGSFSVQHTILENGAKKKKISCRLRIEGRMLDPITKDSYSKVLTDISNFLNCTLLTRKQKSTGNEYYTLTASSKKSLNIIINYLEKYPLFSSKYLDYKDWKEIVILLFENKHGVWSDEAISYAALKKDNMNTRRNLFNWEHLDLLSSYPKNVIPK